MAVPQRFTYYSDVLVAIVAHRHDASPASGPPGQPPEVTDRSMHERYGPTAESTSLGAVSAIILPRLTSQRARRNHRREMINTRHRPANGLRYPHPNDPDQRRRLARPAVARLDRRSQLR